MMVTEFGKSRYNRLPIRMCALGDIYQDKVDEVISDIKCIKTYIADISVLRKESFSNPI